VRWMQYLHHSALLNSVLGLFSIVGFPWLCHIGLQSLAIISMETMKTRACSLLSKKNHLKALLT
jgi:hypothetical protein